MDFHVFGITSVPLISRSGKTSNLPYPCRRKAFKERDHRRRTRILKQNRRATLPDIVEDFRARASTTARVRTAQRTTIDIGCQNQKPTGIALLNVRRKFLRLAFQDSFRCPRDFQTLVESTSRLVVALLCIPTRY